MTARAIATFAERAGRPLLMGRCWAVSSGHSLASWAGARVLERGGTAADAAVAVAAALNVVEPQMSGIGGDLFALVYEAGTSTVWAVNGTGPAPLDATPERFRDGIPERGPLAASVPAAARAWDLLVQRWGRLPLSITLAPAIELARDGFPVSHNLATYIETYADVLASYPETARTFLPTGSPPCPGDVLRQPDLARTLETVAAEGVNALYEGDLAERLTRAVLAAGGLLTLESLRLARATIVEPLQLAYRDWTICVPPPNSSAHTLLEMLGILQYFPLARWRPLSPELLHVMIEAKKLAFLDRERFTGDPDFVGPFPPDVLAPERLQRLAAAIDLTRAKPVLTTRPACEDHTTSFSVMDHEGNLVVVTASLNMAFGSAFIAGDTGILLNNRMTYWHLEPKHPNQLQPGKRVRHTLSPVLLTRPGERLGLGTPGSDAQVQILVHVLVHWLEYGFDLQTAIELPRWRHRGPGHESNWPHGSLDLVQVEGRLPNATIEGLQARGHRVERLARWGPIGSCQGIHWRDAERVVEAAADPRSDAYALAW
jgi:gamma-glutamyltranspeptidase/glutathione hydrolase